MKRIRSLLIVAAMAGSAPALAEPTRAHTPDGSEIEEARQRFQRGVDLYREGSLDAALAEFNKAYELAPNYRVLYNLAQVQNERHEFVAALERFQQYLEEGGAEIPADRREQVTREIAALRGRVAKIVVRANVEGAELLVDGISVGLLPLKDPVLVSSGVRQLQIRKSGYETSARTETIAGGDSLQLNVKLEPVAVTPSSAPSPVVTSDDLTRARSPLPAAQAPTAAPHRSEAPVWITLVSTGLLTGGAVAFGVLTQKANERLDRELDAFPGNRLRIEDARSELKRDALVTDALTAGAVLSGGLFLYFTLSGSGSRSGPTAREKVGTFVRVSPAGTGVRVTGTF